MDPVTRAVAQQYSDYAYPKPIDDIGAHAAAGGMDLCDPALVGPLVWPEGPPRPDLDILVAGCGTQQAAWLAFTNPQARLVGVDLSSASLAHQRYLQDKHGLWNLELYEGDLREVGKLGRSFDLVVSTGVLHHLADPGEGLRALREVMRPDGAMTLMVYGATGRAGVYMLQDACRRLGLGQDAGGVAMVRAMLAALSPHHALQSYVARTRELAFDEAIVDTFLHPQDRAYTVPELLEWLEENGLAFQSWIDNSRYYPEAMIAEPVLSAVQSLPDREQWAVVEKLQGLQGIHMFTARHAGRAVPIGFSQPGWLDYRPRLQPGVVMKENGIVATRDVELGLNEGAAALVRAVNGIATISDILDSPAFAGSPRAAAESFAARVFDRLWKSGAVMFEAPRAGGRAG